MVAVKAGLDLGGAGLGLGGVTMVHWQRGGWQRQEGG